MITISCQNGSRGAPIRRKSLVLHDLGFFTHFLYLVLASGHGSGYNVSMKQNHNTIKNNTLNLISRVLGSHFAMAHNSWLFTPAYALRTLDAYRSVRRRLPVMACGKHYGNHAGSRRKPYEATQGN